MAVCAGTLIGLDRAVTGTAVPYIGLTAALLILIVVFLSVYFTR